jgi:E3 Ubiquitin ligase
MMYLGFFLLALALAVLVVGFIQRKKMKTILAAPFKPTGQALSSPDAKGLVSFQGQVQPTQQLMAPCSGRPCLYYEIEIKQQWEKHVETEDGTKKETGSDSAHDEKQGSTFCVNDGSGPVTVNATDGVDAKLEKVFDEKKSYGWGDISFGNYSTHINSPSDSEKHATGTHCVEKILPAQGSLFVLGKVHDQVVTKRDGLLGTLMLAREGREGLVGATKRNMLIAFVAAGLFFPAGGAMAIFGDAPAAAGDSCTAMKNGVEEPCVGRMYGAEDVVYEWEVTEEADYTFSAVGTGQDTMMRLWPEVEVSKDEEVIFSMTATDGKPVNGKAHITPGTYTIALNDSHYGWAENLKGGAGFELDIDQVKGTKKDPGTTEPVAGESDSVTSATAQPGKLPTKATVKTKATKANKASNDNSGENVEAKAKAEEKVAEVKTEEKAEEKVAEVKTEEKAEEKVAEAKAATPAPRRKTPQLRPTH